MLDECLPLIPAPVLKAHHVSVPDDSRFRAAARLLQALWREERSLPIGSHRDMKGTRRKLGSRIHARSGTAGANFLFPEIADLARRELIYREVGAFIDEDRLMTNLLSSQPLCFNLFGALKLDMEKANLLFRSLFPDYVQHVQAIQFEHSPGRGNPAFTQDGSAFDVFVSCVTPDGEAAFIAIEMKYSETLMSAPLAALRPRYDELSATLPVFRDPAAPALRQAPLQQLWREHMLSRAMVDNCRYSQGRFVVIYPEQNLSCEAATNAYQRQLVSPDPAVTGFQAVTLESCVASLKAVGDDRTASALHARYLDFGRLERAIFG